jgi:hypothetical protein
MSSNEKPGDLRNFNVSLPPGRILIDAYEIAVNFKTGKVEAAKVRTPLIHWDVTQDVLYGSPLWFDCSELECWPLDFKNSFTMRLTLRNNSAYE